VAVETATRVITPMIGDHDGRNISDNGRMNYILIMLNQINIMNNNFWSIKVSTSVYSVIVVVVAIVWSGTMVAMLVRAVATMKITKTVVVV